MLHWIHDILDQQIHFIETKGAWIIIPIFGINSFIVAWFVNINGLGSAAELTKNVILALIGIAMGVMGVVNTYIGMKRRIRKFKEENKEAKSHKISKNHSA